jgi:hypothetical protein
MAKKTARRRKGVNKSQVIRDYLAKHKNAMPKQIIADLAGEGVKVSHALVSNVKYGEKKKAGGRKKGRKVSRKAKLGTNSLTANELLKAKQLADQLGGADRLKTALETLEKLK